MILSTVGKDGGNPLESNLYADNGTITAKVIDGTLSISNDGAVGAYADNGGSITLEGPVVMDVGTGAAAANDGTILFKGPIISRCTAPTRSYGLSTAVSFMPMQPIRKNTLTEISWHKAVPFLLI